MAMNTWRYRHAIRAGAAREQSILVADGEKAEGVQNIASSNQKWPAGYAEGMSTSAVSRASKADAYRVRLINRVLRAAGWRPRPEFVDQRNYGLRHD